MHSNHHYVKATFVIVIASLVVLLMPLLASDYGDILAIFYPACIYSASRLSRSKNNKILIGFLYLILYHIINLFWLYKTGSYVNVTLLLLILPSVYLLPVTVLVRSQFALFVLIWLAIDYIMLVWELGFPLLSIGHHLAFVPSLIFLGKWGGSLLINLLVLVSNLIAIRIIFTSGYKYKDMSIGLGLILLVMGSSFLSTDPEGREIDVLSINTSLKCPDEKYSKSTAELHAIYMDKIIKNCSQISHPIDLIVLPETAYDDLGGTDEIFDNRYLKDLEQLDQCDGFLIGGVLSSRPFLFEQHKPNGYSYMSNRPVFYHNSSIVVAGGMRQIKHKQVLVPFNEYIPDLFYRILPKVKPSFKHFRKDNNEVFSPFTIGNIMLGTAICYESLFGYKVSRSVASGANLIAFQYNEGWYNSKHGARKMLAHACLRANEVHKYVVNSSNCGYSAIIDVNGRIVKKTSDSVDLKGVVHLNMKSTPYVIVGDLVGTLSIVALLYLGVFNYSYFRSA